MNPLLPPSDPLRQELAGAAARLIAENGYDYGTAKQKAAQELLGKQRVDKNSLPSNEETEEELRIYQALFQSDTQPQRLKALRLTCLDLMKELQAYEPIVYGGIVNGTAGEHSDIHLLAFADDPKEVDYWLLNQNIPFEPAEVGKINGKAPDAIQFKYKGEWVSLATLGVVARRGLLKPAVEGRLFRTDTEGLARLLKEDNETVE